MASQLSANKEKLQSLIDQIYALPERGTDLPELTNPGVASDLLSGKELIDADGNIVTGTIKTKGSGDLTVSGATVSVPAGYYASEASKSVATATQATPSVSIDSSGKITAIATQDAGYVSSGTKTGTKQLTVQAAQTITPGTSNKTIASGRYLTGTQTIKGDANLVAGNIAKDVTIFGVMGTHEGGEDVSAETAEYTSLLTDLETAIDALPDAGSGGSAVETCTITNTGEINNVICYYSDGAQIINHIFESIPSAITVAKNSIIYMVDPNGVARFTGLQLTGGLSLISIIDSSNVIFTCTGDGTIGIEWVEEEIPGL